MVLQIDGGGVDPTFGAIQSFLVARPLPPNKLLDFLVANRRAQGIVNTSE
ncbi:MAG: hypothetical protein ABI862_03930 [Ilumatobacteraceae bacterium]